MNKFKLLAWHDFLCNTGFGKVAKNLLLDLDTYFQIEVVGINYNGKDKYDNSKYFVYPTTDRNDPIGVNLLIEVAEKTQPHVIFLLQDIFNIEWVLPKLKEVAPHSKVVIYFPVDGYPLQTLYKAVSTMPDYIFHYTEWAKAVFEEFYPDCKISSSVLYHGVDFEVFKPLAPAIIKDEKIELNWENRFIVLNVNRLQPRKQIPTTLRVFSMFSKGYNSCNNCKHRQPLNMTRCELCTSTRLTKHTAGKKDDVHLHIHSELKSSAMGVTFLDGIVPYAMQAGFETNDFGPILSLNSAPIQEVGEDTINILYNLADVNISTTVGEGAGLSFLEAAALGLPSIAPKHSAIPEMLGNFGDMIENVAVFTHKDHTGYFRPIVNEWEMVKALERYYTKWRIAGQDLQKNKAQITWAKKVFSWEDKRENLKNVLLKYATESQQAPSTAP